MPRGKPFEKGNKLSKGRPRLDPEAKQHVKLTREKVELTFSRFIEMPIEELKAWILARQGSVLELMIARVIEKSIATGDHQRLNFLMDRLVGKVPQQLEASDQGFTINIRNYTETKE